MEGGTDMEQAKTERPIVRATGLAAFRGIMESDIIELF
jgi:hypothetical protein